MNKFKLLILFLLPFTFFVNAQKIGWKSLGKAEKIWVLTHPFSANKAKKLTKTAIEVADSVAKAEDWLILKSGGEKDAFRHAYWMALMSERIGPKRAFKLGLAHEKKNRNDFLKGQEEEGALPDLRSKEMDLYNNQAGISIANQCEDCSNNTLVKAAVSALEKGKLKIIKMDEKGNSLDSSGSVIPQKAWEGKWENDRLLVPSDYHLNAKSKIDP